MPSVAREDSRGASGIHLVEELPACNPRGALSTSIATVKEELDVILARDVLRVIERIDLPNNANLLGFRITRGIKNLGTTSESFEVCFVVQGNKDSETILQVFVLGIGLRIRTVQIWGMHYKDV